MAKSFVAKVLMFFAAVFPLWVQAESVDTSTHLSNVQIQYVETRPSAEEKGTPRGKARAIFKQFESGVDNTIRSVGNTESDIQMAENIAFENGYFEMPIPLFDALVNGFAAYQVTSAPLYVSAARTKEQGQALKSEIEKKFTPLVTKADFTLTLMPYRVAYQDANNSVIKIGVLLWDAKAGETIWVYYINVPFGTARKGFKEADGKRMASLLIDEMVNKGWLVALKQETKGASANRNY
jgi:hypothetical protein